jgi:hypothetical protein
VSEISEALEQIASVARSTNKPFDPATDLGIPEEEFIDYLNECLDVIRDKSITHKGSVLCKEEDLVFLVVLGTYAGIVYQKNKEGRQ